MDPRLLDLVWEAYRSVGARDYIHVVSAYRSPATNSMLRKRSQGRRQQEPAHARQGDGFLHSGRQPEEAARHRPEGAGRRRRLLSALGFAFRAYGCRQCPPLAAHEPQGTGAPCSRTARRCMCRATASRCPASRRRSLPTSRARRAAPPRWRLRSSGDRAGPAACSRRSSAAAPTRKKTTATAQRRSCRRQAGQAAAETVAAEALGQDPDRSARTRQSAPSMPCRTKRPTRRPRRSSRRCPSRDIPLPGFAPRPQMDVGAVDAAKWPWPRNARQHSVRHGRRGTAGGRWRGDRRRGRRQYSAADLAAGRRGETRARPRFWPWRLRNRNWLR